LTIATVIKKKAVRLRKKGTYKQAPYSQGTTYDDPLYDERNGALLIILDAQKKVKK
jgi:hypothetical protein